MSARCKAGICCDCEAGDCGTVTALRAELAAAIARAETLEAKLAAERGKVGVNALARLVRGNEAAERVVEAARAYFEEAYIKHTETDVPPQDEDEEPTCVGCIVEGGLNVALLAYDAAKAVPRG